MEIPCTKTNCLDRLLHHSPFCTNGYHLSFSYLQSAAAKTTKQMPGAPELLISNSTTKPPLRNENTIWELWSDDIIQTDTVKLVMGNADELLDWT